MRDASLERFAVNLEMWWTDRDPLDRLSAAAAAGFEWVEIWYWREWDVTQLAEALTRHDLRLAQLGGWDFEPALSDRAVHDRFETGIHDAIDVARTLHTSRININGPLIDETRSIDDQRSAVCEALSRVAPLAEQAEITLMVEPMNTRVDHPGYLFPTSGDVIAVCETVGSDRVKINWDLYHLHISEGDLTGHLNEGASHVGYVQIADHPGRHEPGTGEISYGFVLDHLDIIGYRGPVGLECSPAFDAESAVDRVRGLSREKHGFA